MIVTRKVSKKKNQNTKSIVKVLLVEDEPIFQQLHYLMLEELGCYVDVAETGEQVLASVINQYDLILMDVGLPDIRGTTVIDRIRSNELVDAKVPIIVLTAYNKMDVEAECISAGATAVFNKPVTYEDLKRIIKKYFSQI